MSNQRAIIDLSLQILRAAIARAMKEPVNTIEVRLALRCLLPHCPEKWPLTSFWRAADAPNEIGRYQNCQASYNGIVLQLKAAGRWPG